MTGKNPIMKRQELMPYLLISGISFLSAAVIILIVFAIFGMAPFGNHGLLYRDGEIQMVDLFCWYKDVLTGKSSIGYTFTKSLGGSNFSVFTYYLASPLSLLVVFFNKSDVPLFMNILFILKAALAASFMGIYLTYRFEPDSKSKYFVSVILSVSYALNPFFITQSSNTMWLDGAYMLPLMIMGAEKIAQGRKSYLLTITTALALCFNWYSGIIDLMFCCFWFLFEFIRIRLAGNEGKKPFLIQDIQFTVQSNRIPKCVASINVYRIEGKPETFTNILHKPIYFNIDTFSSPRSFNIQPDESILLEPGNYFISFQIVAVDEDLMREFQNTPESERVHAFGPYFASFPVYLKSSYIRHAAMGKMEHLPVNIGVAVKGLEYQ